MYRETSPEFFAWYQRIRISIIGTKTDSANSPAKPPSSNRRHRKTRNQVWLKLQNGVVGMAKYCQSNAGTASYLTVAVEKLSLFNAAASC